MLVLDGRQEMAGSASEARRGKRRWVLGTVLAVVVPAAALQVLLGNDEVVARSARWVGLAAAAFTMVLIAARFVVLRRARRRYEDLHQSRLRAEEAVDPPRRTTRAGSGNRTTSRAH